MTDPRTVDEILAAQGAQDEVGVWKDDVELDTAAPGGVDEATDSAPAGVATAGAIGLDAIMAGLAAIADELKRIADVLERVDENGVTTYDGNVT